LPWYTSDKDEPAVVDTKSLVEAWYIGVVSKVTATAPKTATTIVTPTVTHRERNSFTKSCRFNAPP
jgi:hypothetical protein